MGIVSKAIRISRVLLCCRCSGCNPIVVWAVNAQLPSVHNDHISPPLPAGMFMFDDDFQAFPFGEICDRSLEGIELMIFFPFGGIWKPFSWTARRAPRKPQTPENEDGESSESRPAKQRPTRWWQLKYFLFSPRKLGKWSNLTSIFFKRLKPPTCFLHFSHFFSELKYRIIE